MTQPEPQSRPNSLRQTFGAIQIHTRGRGLILGESGSGKSTLAERLIEHWLADRRNPHVLILDGKPRFRGMWELNGFSAAKRYKHWQRGPTIPESYLLPLVDPAAELAQAWRLGGRVAIAQTDASSAAGIEALRGAARAFYSTSRDRFDQLLYVDELADFFGTTGAASRGDALLLAVRSGREKNVSFLGGAQRPKGLPSSFHTELSDVYLFALAAERDRTHLDDMGIPGDLPPGRLDHTFVHYDKRKRVARRYRLNKELLEWGHL